MADSGKFCFEMYWEVMDRLFKGALIIRGLYTNQQRSCFENIAFRLVTQFVGVPVELLSSPVKRFRPSDPDTSGNKMKSNEI